MLQSQALDNLANYVKTQEFKGWDLFDGLNSRLFQATPLYRCRSMRLAWIQLFKRSPINLRWVTGVPKGYNAKGLGLFVSAFLALGHNEQAKILLEQLKGMTCADFPGASWGYNFDWEARAFYVPQGKPNIVTTVFVADAFLDFFEQTGESEALSLAESACEFILKSLVLHEDKSTLCFGYIPGEGARVHNANMLGAALLGRVFAHTGTQVFLEKSRKSMAYSVSALKDDFSWPYGELNHHQFIDNFHTGFNLVALKGWMDHTGERQWNEMLAEAYRYFLNTFWLENGCPRYYSNSLYPIDIHCSAQGIITCLKLRDYDARSLPLANTIATWTLENMQDKDGFFYYQKSRWYTNKIPYIRWSQAWMFLALSTLVATGEEKV
ncbi:MAG: hypothetical protein HGB35_07165 [Geobacteraceae bacterium]|nr:hypothetical protein [Geobacteraceae bacterium]